LTFGGACLLAIAPDLFYGCGRFYFAFPNPEGPYV